MTGEFWKNILFKGETIWFHRIRATDGQFGKKHSPQKIPDSADFGTTHNLGHNIFKKPTTKSFLKTPPQKTSFLMLFLVVGKNTEAPLWVFTSFYFPFKKKSPIMPWAPHRTRGLPVGVVLGQDALLLWYTASWGCRFRFLFFVWRDRFLKGEFSLMHHNGNELGACNSLYSFVSKSSWGRNYMNLWNTFTLKWDFGGV